jgi:hypothetical protein
MITRALASPSLAARHQGSFMFLAWTQTTAAGPCGRPIRSTAVRHKVGSLFNATTFALAGTIVENASVTPKLHHSS